MKIVIGVPGYRTVAHSWYSPLIMQASNLHKYDIELLNVTSVGGMMVDVSRNYIVDEFLKTEADALMFIDDDNVHAVNTISLLAQTNKEAVVGAYKKRKKDGGLLVFIGNGSNYMELSQYVNGEIIPVDSAGLGAALIRREVFETIQKDFRVFERVHGGLHVAHREDIVGDVFKDDADSNDGLVVNGVFHDRLQPVQPSDDPSPFPYFMLSYGRTEDVMFWEIMKRAGYQLWCDTGVQVPHVGEAAYMPEKGRIRE